MSHPKKRLTDDDFDIWDYEIIENHKNNDNNCLLEFANNNHNNNNM